MSTYLRGDVSSISGTVVGSGTNFVFNDVKAWGWLNRREAVDITRFSGIDDTEFTLHLSEGRIRLVFYVDGDGAFVPIPSGTLITIAIKQATGHTAQRFNMLALDCYKSGNYSNDGRAEVIVNGIQTGSVT